MTDPLPFRAFRSTAPIEYTSLRGNLEYSGWKDEQLSWKTTCCIGDWSFVPQIRVTGPDAMRLFSDLCINSLENWPAGRAKHGVMCNEDGKVITEGILLRHGEDDLEYQATVPQWVLFNLVRGGYDAVASFPFSYKFQVAGPRSLELLEKLTRITLRDVRFMHTKVVPIVGRDVVALRQGMSGEIGFELQGPIEQHDEVHAAVMAAGREFGIRRLGRRTVQINHLEASYPTGSVHYFNALADERRADYHAFVDDDANVPPEWRDTIMGAGRRRSFSTSFTGSWDGESITELYRSPVEMGWSRVIRFDHDFLGRESLEKEAADPRRALVTLELDSDDLVRVYASQFGPGESYQLFEMPHAPYVTCWTDWIIKDGRKVGHSTHPGFSAYFRRALSLSFIDVEHAEPGTEVSILWGNPGSPQTEIRARVAPAPYKTDRARGALAAEPGAPLTARMPPSR